MTRNFCLVGIFITLRADHLGCYGYQRMTSPFIDILSQDAFLFANCKIQGTSTLISHASIFTSLIPLHHGASFTHKFGLPDEVQTIAEILKENGYTTVSFNDGGQISAKFGMDQCFDFATAVMKKIKNISSMPMTQKFAL